VFISVALILRWCWHRSDVSLGNIVMEP